MPNFLPPVLHAESDEQNKIHTNQHQDWRLLQRHSQALDRARTLAMYPGVDCSIKRDQRRQQYHFSRYYAKKKQRKQAKPVTWEKRWPLHSEKTLSYK
jgi:hypothetical protein